MSLLLQSVVAFFTLAASNLCTKKTEISPAYTGAYVARGFEILSESIGLLHFIQLAIVYNLA